MATRYFMAWRMFVAADRNRKAYLQANAEARARASFNPLIHLSARQFKNRYRLSKQCFKHLCKDLKQFTNLKCSRVSLEHKVLTALLFFASGTYQKTLGVAKHISQKMCSVYIEEVTQALTHKNIIEKYIRFPNTPSARQATNQRFYRKYGMPGVVGCIDCTHIKIVVPKKEEEHLYYSRKHYHSLNVQMICDDEYRVLNVNAKFGGANHDAFIWENSVMNTYMKSLHQTGEIVWLLGDSGYPQRPWLMTPDLEDPSSRYNYNHMRARVVIENTFSRLKNRWRCINKDRTLHYKPVKCARIVLACCVLHNVMIHYGSEEMEEDMDFDIGTRNEEQISYVENGEATSDLIRGRVLRDQLKRRLNNNNFS